MGLPSRKEVSEAVYKWRYKLTHLGNDGEKTLADFSSESDLASNNDEKSKTNTSSSGGPSQKLDVGNNVSIKTLYEGPDSHGEHFDWIDYPPRQLSKSAAKAQSRVAIKVFKTKDREKPVISGRYSLRYHQIEVQNSLLVAALGKILKKQDIHLDVEESATFTHPFQSLFFAYDDIVAKYESLDNEERPTLGPFVLLLIKLLDDIFADTRAKLRGLKKNNLVTFKLAWTYFPKNTTLITWGPNCELLTKVTGTEYRTVENRIVLVVKGEVVSFDGKRFYWESYETCIPSFSGNKPITDLSAYPLEYHEDAEGVRERFTARGKKMLDYQGLTYINYSGVAIHSVGKKGERHNVEGRVLIDVVGYNKHHLTKGSREDDAPRSRRRRLTPAPSESQKKKKSVIVDADGNLEIIKSEPTKHLSKEDQEKNREAMLALEEKEPHLMYLMPLIEGYALKNKLWVSFYVEDIQPMTWNDAAYDHLVYDEAQKDLVMSFVESHGQSKVRAMEDVIAGKGQGLVILLSGPPGTGKTLTAEAVADRTKRPLFYLQAEDLGTNAAILGANVKRVFQMATEWDAVILLDEADVFMAERHPQDIARNELVSIFLRELEYFRGIIFLTTNLYSTIDSAFRSRVSLHLLFKPLTVEARMTIWQKFLSRVITGKGKGKGLANADQGEEEQKVEEELPEEDIKELAAWQLNGREIKTAVKMARTWCDHKGYELTLSRLENAIKVTSPHASKDRHEGDTSLYDE
ncbi:ATP-dependent zinc metalloprotease YME1L1 [Podospora fimiseda]|uniref:ATP-dependent zinc metalloprotease YME1L1 n=1 Tax=Podospora fimiseda TaxID=252190 RepID=A0AAN6YTH6_9PEZI|nr:ATP-dependent zinc metalloprotease YME1L1 [Podospora fimiseda]